MAWSDAARAAAAEARRKRNRTYPKKGSKLSVYRVEFARGLRLLRSQHMTSYMERGKNALIEQSKGILKRT